MYAPELAWFEFVFDCLDKLYSARRQIFVSRIRFNCRLALTGLSERPSFPARRASDRNAGVPARSPEGRAAGSVSAGVMTRTSVPRPINIDGFKSPTRTTTCTAPVGTCTVGGIPT